MRELDGSDPITTLAAVDRSTSRSNMSIRLKCYTRTKFSTRDSYDSFKLKISLFHSLFFVNRIFFFKFGN